MNLNRRQFISKTLQAALGSLFPVSVFANGTPERDDARILSFYNLHTTERLSACYFKNGRFQVRALQQIDFILRDHRSGETRPMDRRLLDLLFALSREVHSTPCFHVISGYRSPATNARLRKRSKGVAGGSLHMAGKAIDLRIPGIDSSRLRQMGQDLKSGGVGYYPQSDFVHLDTGRIRTWQG